MLRAGRKPLSSQDAVERFRVENLPRRPILHWRSANSLQSACNRRCSELMLGYAVLCIDQSGAVEAPFFSSAQIRYVALVITLASKLMPNLMGVGKRSPPASTAAVEC